MGNPIMSTSSYNYSNDNLTNTHSHGASHHEWFPAYFVDEIDGWDGCCDVDNTDDSRSEKRDCAACQAQRLEDDRCVVDDYKTVSYEY